MPMVAAPAGGDDSAVRAVQLRTLNPGSSTTRTRRGGGRRGVARSTPPPPPLRGLVDPERRDCGEADQTAARAGRGADLFRREAKHAQTTCGDPSATASSRRNSGADTRVAAPHENILGLCSSSVSLEHWSMPPDVECSNRIQNVPENQLGHRLNFHIPKHSPQTWCVSVSPLVNPCADGSCASCAVWCW
jgi:hypothetical protein